MAIRIEVSRGTELVKEHKGPLGRAQKRETCFPTSIVADIRMGLLDLQLFLSSFLPPYGTVFRHSKDLSPQEKAYREMDLMGF